MFFFKWSLTWCEHHIHAHIHAYMCNLFTFMNSVDIHSWTGAVGVVCLVLCDWIDLIGLMWLDWHTYTDMIDLMCLEWSDYVDIVVLMWLSWYYCVGAVESWHDWSDMIGLVWLVWMGMVMIGLGMASSSSTT